MAATVSAIKFQNQGSEQATEGLITFSSTYTTNGVALTALQLGLGTVNACSFDQGGYVFKYDIANEKVKLYQVAGFTPAGSGTAAAQVFTGTLGTAPTFTVTKGAILASSELGLSADATSATVNNNAIASTLTLLAANSPVGATTPAGTNATSAVTFTGTAVAAGALIEVANATSIAAVTTNFRAIGY